MGYKIDMKLPTKHAIDVTVFDAPPAEDRYPFWLTQSGISSKTRPMQHLRLQSDVSCIQYVISGAGTINIGGHTYTAGPGDTFLLLAGLDQNYYSYNADHWECLWINFEGVLSEELLKIYRLTDTVVFHNANSYPILMEIYDTVRTETDPATYKEKTTRLFFGLVQFLSQQQPKQREDMEIPDLVRSYIDCHVADTVRLSDIADITHQSAEHIIRTFKDKYGITPYQYLLKSKMCLARIMLGHSDKTVEEIAAELGFYDTHHFSVRFKKMHGCRPTVYRQQYKQKEDGGT